jgi:K+/H+ antiporter YhaU regulatory subunit KhtT
MLIAIKRRGGRGAPEVTMVAPGAEAVILEGDVLTLLGSNERLGALDATWGGTP